MGRKGASIIVLLLAPMLYVSAQEPPLAISRAEYPILEQHCHKQQRDWGGKPDWQANCKLAVWKEIEWTDEGDKVRKERRGYILFELALILPHPANYDECEARVKRWMLKDAPEMLRRVGWLESEKKEKRKK